MTIGEALRTELLDDAAVAALVDDRINPAVSIEAAINQGPMILYSTGATFTPHLGAAAFGESRYCVIRALARDFDEARSLADAANAVLDNFQGVMGGAGGPDIGHWTREQEDAEVVDVSGKFIVYGVVTRYSYMIQGG